MHITHPQNLEEQALALVGQDVYEKLVEGYTRKQWGRPCKELPSFIIKDFLFAIPMTTTISRILIRGFPKAAIHVLLKAS